MVKLFGNHFWEIEASCLPLIENWTTTTNQGNLLKMILPEANISMEISRRYVYKWSKKTRLDFSLLGIQIPLWMFDRVAHPTKTYINTNKSPTYTNMLIRIIHKSTFKGVPKSSVSGCQFTIPYSLIGTSLKVLVVEKKLLFSKHHFLRVFAVPFSGLCRLTSHELFFWRSFRRPPLSCVRCRSTRRSWRRPGQLIFFLKRGFH